MTTLVFDGKTLASDSQMTAGSTIMSMKAKKVHKLKGNKKYKSVAFSGSVMEINTLLKWFKSDMKKDEFPIKNGDNVAYGIAITHKNKAHLYYGEYEYVVSDQKFCCMGSGSDFAIASLMSGNDAEESVKIACKLDIYSGGKVQKVC